MAKELKPLHNVAKEATSHLNHICSLPSSNRGVQPLLLREVREVQGGCHSLEDAFHHLTDCKPPSQDATIIRFLDKLNTVLCDVRSMNTGATPEEALRHIFEVQELNKRIKGALGCTDLCSLRRSLELPKYDKLSQGDRQAMIALNPRNDLSPEDLRSIYDNLPCEACVEEDEEDRLVSIMPPRVGSSMVLNLALSAVSVNAVDLLSTLLGKGVSVEPLLEQACRPGNLCTKATFQELLKHADSERLNRPDSPPLLYLLSDVQVFDRDGKLKTLLANGINPNVVRDGRPVLIEYIRKGQEDAALFLLDQGADASLATGSMDAALAAATWGSARVLEKITPPPWDHTYQLAFYPNGQSPIKLCCNVLHVAAFENHAQIIRHFAASPEVDLNCPTLITQYRPIHLAAAANATKCIEALNNAGADLSARLLDGSTPLHIAAKYGRIKAIRTLLKLRPHLRYAADENGMAPILHAFNTGLRDVIEIFLTSDEALTEGVTPGEPTPQSQAIQPQLIFQAITTVIRSGDVSWCKRLLKVLPASFESPLSCGCTPLIFAIRKKKSAVIEWLSGFIKEGFIGSCSSSKHFDSDERGFNALNMLCEDPELHGCLDAMLKAYYRQHLNWTNTPIPAIHAAAEADNALAIDAIVNHIKANPIDYGRWLGIRMADSRVVLQRLLSQRASGLSGQTPLHVAAGNHSEEAMARLIGYGVDVNAQDDRFNQPLHLAVKQSFIRGIEMLLLHGADVHRHYRQGDSLLMAAADNGSTEAMDLLISAGADIQVTNADGMTLLNITGERNSSPNAFHYLRTTSGDLDPYRKEKAGYMPLTDMLLNYNMLGYVLNIDFDFCRQGDVSKGLLSVMIDLNRDNALPMLKRVLRRLPKASDMVNWFGPRYVSPLCSAVYKDINGAIDVLVRSGADVNLEGSEEGTALMTACTRGRLQSVKDLVRLGAWISYTTQEGKVRNGVGLAARYEFSEIVEWLLVGRFTNLKAIERSATTSNPEEKLETELKRESKKQRGYWMVTYQLFGVGDEYPRCLRESSIEYLIRTNRVRERLRGKVIHGPLVKVEQPELQHRSDLFCF